MPERGLARRITVQIALGAELSALPAAKPEAEPQAAPLSEDWFWSRISPSLIEGGGGALRFLDAVARLDDAGIGGPRLADLQKIADRYGAAILRETVGRRVSPALVLAVIFVESAGRPEAVSSAGASGLMQLMPATAARFAVTDRADPGQSIRGGVAYLDWLMREFEGDAILALAGYNAGEASVRRNMGVPPYAETRGYVPKVLAAWRVARGLCLTPPDLPDDGCVFAVRTALAQ